MKVIFSGFEGSGKSLKLAMVAVDIVKRNGKWFERQQKEYLGALEAREDFLVKWEADERAMKQYDDLHGIPVQPLPRPIWSNLLFSDEFTEFALELGIEIKYWNNLDDLIKIEQADVFIDEVGNYFDSRLWADLSLDVRRWLTQGSKMGIELYGTAQDFAQVDKAFRRLCNSLLHIVKVIGSPRPSATRPPVKKIWGLCMVFELDPQGYDEDKKKFGGGGTLPAFFFIEKQYCDIFDTTQKILRSKPALLKHIDRFCESDTCSYHKIMHV